MKLNYYKEHNPTKEQIEAVELEDKRRRISCTRILEEHFKKEMEKKQSKLFKLKARKQ